MKALRLGGWILAALVVLVAAALLAIHWFVNPNDFKGLITQTVRRSTGRELSLGGDLKLSVFPVIALQTGAASLGNPPGFSTEPFAAVQSMSLSVRLLPLLHRQLQIGRIEVNGLDLRLRRDAQGRGNWQGFGGQSSAPGAQSASSSAPSLAELGGIALRNARLQYQDTVVQDIDLDLGRLAAGVAVPLKLSLQLRRGGNTPAVPVALSVPQLRLDLDAQTVQAPQFEAQLGSAHLTGTLQGVHILDAPDIQGSFQLPAFAPRQLLSQLGVSLPPTRDAQAFGRAAVSAEFRYGANALHLTHLTATLDRSTLRGNCAITDLDTNALSFALTLDRLDIDAYRSPVPAQSRTAAAPAATAPTKLPVDMLRALQLDGTFAVGQATFAGLQLTQLQLALHADHGLVRLAPVSARLYSGDYAGEITLDSRPAVPALTLQQRLTQIDMAPLLQDFAKTQRLSGRATLTAQLTAHGGTDDALLRSLDGPVSASVDKGAVNGIDLWFEINRALALLQKQALPSGSDSGSTRFDAFKVSALLTDGVAKTNDLQIVSQNLHVSGQGTANLVTDALNLQLKTTLLKGGAASSGTLAEVPLTVTGTLASPRVQPDLEGMAKARLQQEIDNHKQDLQQQLQNRLQDLLRGK